MDKDCEHLVGMVEGMHGPSVITGPKVDRLKGATFDRFRFCPRCGKSLASFWLTRSRPQG